MNLQPSNVLLFLKRMSYLLMFSLFFFKLMSYLTLLFHSNALFSNLSHILKHAPYLFKSLTPLTLLFHTNLLFSINFFSSFFFSKLAFPSREKPTVHQFISLTVMKRHKGETYSISNYLLDCIEVRLGRNLQYINLTRKTRGGIEVPPTGHNFIS